MGCKRGASGSPVATAVFCWGKKDVLRAGGKYRKLDVQNQKWGDFICPRGRPCLALVEDAPTPFGPAACGKSLQGAAPAPARLSPTSESKPAANPVFLAVSAWNRRLPGYLQAFCIGEAPYAKIVKEGQEVCVWGISERSGKAQCPSGNH